VSLFAFFKKSLGAKGKNGLNVVTCRVFVIHLLHNKMIKDQLLFAVLHDSLCENVVVQMLHIDEMQIKRTLSRIFHHQFENQAGLLLSVPVGPGDSLPNSISESTH
jgi:hypothetical protein